MGTYTAIADTGQRMVALLQRELIPEVLHDPDEIGLRSPQEHGDVSLGLFLYDIRESEEIRLTGRKMIRNEQAGRAPVYLSLYYMVTAYSGGDVKYRLVQEERILGRVIQTFYDYPMLSAGEAGTPESAGPLPRISLLSVDMDEKSRIWNFPDTKHRLSIFYRVSPVALESGISEKIARVTELDIHIAPSGFHGR